MSATGTDLVELLSSIIELDDEIKALESQLKTLNQKRELQAMAAVDAMAEAGMQSAKINGRTLHLARDLYVNVPAENREKLAEYCEGHDEMAELVEVGVNTSRLKSYIREELGETKAVSSLPEELRQLVRVCETFKLRNRRS